MGPTFHALRLNRRRTHEVCVTLFQRCNALTARRTTIFSRAKLVTNVPFFAADEVARGAIGATRYWVARAILVVSSAACGSTRTRAPSRVIASVKRAEWHLQHGSESKCCFYAIYPRRQSTPLLLPPCSTHQPEGTQKDLLPTLLLR